MFLLLLIGSAFADCSRPTDYHWLNNLSPTNTSITLFNANNGVIDRQYITFSSSTCLQTTSENYVFYCRDKSFSIPCEESSHNVVGLGQNSPIWNHYQYMEFDSQRIILSNNVKNFTQQCMFQPKLPYDREHYLCYLENIETNWEYKKEGRSEKYSVILFNKHDKTYIPKSLYETFQEAVSQKRYEDIFINLKINNKEWRCAENCLYTNNFFKGFELTIGVHPDEDGTIELTEGFLHYKKLSYDAFSQTIQLDTKNVFIKKQYKFWVQILLLPKLVYGFWSFTRNIKETSELKIEVIDMIIIPGIVLEEYFMNTMNNHHFLLTFIMVCILLFVKMLEYGLYDLRSNSNFDAIVVIGNYIQFLILQTILQELDSYECVVIALFLQTALVFDDALKLLFMFYKKTWYEYISKGIVVFFCLFVIIMNHGDWLSILFEELSSLLGYEKNLLVITYYCIIIVIVTEVWKKG